MLGEVIVLGFIAWRLAYFIAYDTIFEGSREKLLNIFEMWAIKNPDSLRLKIYEKFEYLVFCILCLTFWTSLFFYSIPDTWKTILGAWGVGSFIFLITDSDEREPEVE